jgi:hypothetical protein
VSGRRNESTPRTVTARTMTILSAFSRERPTMRLQEISRQTGLTVSTTHRGLVTELVEWGALTRTDVYTYRIGPLSLFQPDPRDWPSARRVIATNE